MFFAGAVDSVKFIGCGQEVELGSGGFAFDDDVAGFGGFVVAELFEGFIDPFIVLACVVDGVADLGKGCMSEACAEQEEKYLFHG